MTRGRKIQLGQKSALESLWNNCEYRIKCSRSYFVPIVAIHCLSPHFALMKMFLPTGTEQDMFRKDLFALITIFKMYEHLTPPGYASS